MSIPGVLRVPLVVTVATVTAIALALPSHAAPLAVPAAAPKGGAVVSVSGGDATVRQVRAHRYRLVVPKAASLAWLGDPGNETLWGFFTPRSLVSGWTGLGHRAGVGVATTLSWGPAEASQRSMQLVLASDPRVNAQGDLTFRIDTKNALPDTLDNFRMTVTRVAKGARGFPLYGKVLVTTGVYAVTTAQGGPASYGAGAPSTGSVSGCWSYTFSSDVTTSNIPSNTRCNNLYLNGDIVQLGNASETCIFDSFFISLSQSTSSPAPTTEYIPLQWTPSGSVVPAGGKC